MNDEKKFFGNGDYVTIKAPSNFPGYKFQGKYCYEHHYIYWKNTGELPKKGITELHHKNGDKKDNSFDNLEMTYKSRHFKKHHHKKSVSWVKLKCPSCGKIFEKPLRRTHLSKSSKSKATFCSRECAGKFNQFSTIDLDSIKTNVID